MTPEPITIDCPPGYTPKFDSSSHKITFKKTYSLPVPFVGDVWELKITNEQGALLLSRWVVAEVQTGYYNLFMISGRHRTYDFGERFYQSNKVISDLETHMENDRYWSLLSRRTERT